MNILLSIWKYKCPRCRQGDLFVEPFDFKQPLKMHEQCAHCKQKFEPEPGYYFGAMFISYIWTAWLSLAIIGFCMLVLDWSLEASFALLVAAMVISFFFIMRISRSMYIHINVKFNEKLADTPKK